MKLSHLDCSPVIPDSCFVDVSARINGDVRLGEECSVWFNVCIRGDVNSIRVGNRTNIQDACIFHTSYQTHPLQIGDDVTLGHGVIAHGCTIGNRVLVGMGTIVMDGALIGDEVLLGAGSLVTEFSEIPGGMLAFGRPAKVVRPLKPEERGQIRERAEHYLACAQAYRNQGRFTGWSDNPMHPDRTH